jgi:hypothetical protein
MAGTQTDKELLVAERKMPKFSSLRKLPKLKIAQSKNNSNNQSVSNVFRKKLVKPIMFRIEDLSRVKQFNIIKGRTNKPEIFQTSINGKCPAILPKNSLTEIVKKRKQLIGDIIGPTGSQSPEVDSASKQIQPMKYVTSYKDLLSEYNKIFSEVLLWDSAIGEPQNDRIIPRKHSKKRTISAEPPRRTNNTAMTNPNLQLTRDGFCKKQFSMTSTKRAFFKGNHRRCNTNLNRYYNENNNIKIVNDDFYTKQKQKDESIRFQNKKLRDLVIVDNNNAQNNDKNSEENKKSMDIDCGCETRREILKANILNAKTMLPENKIMNPYKKEKDLLSMMTFFTRDLKKPFKVAHFGK